MSRFEAYYRRWRTYLLPFEWAFTITYFLLCVYVVFFARSRRAIVQRQRNLRPVKGMLQRYHELSTGDAAAIASFYENLYGNILMFIPLPIIMLTLLKMRNRWLVLFYCAGISCGIEVVQYYFAIGVADSDDIILNSTGALIGILLYSAYAKFLLGGTRNSHRMQQVRSNSLS